VRRLGLLGLLLLTGCGVSHYNGTPQIMCGTNSTTPVRAEWNYCEGGNPLFRYYAASPAVLTEEHDVPIGAEIPAVYLR